MAEGFIPLAKQMDFLWSELQGKEKAGFGKFLTAGVNTPEDYATLWDKTYERSGGAGDAKARDYAGSVYAAMADGGSNPELISPNAKFTYGYLTDKGMTPQQAAGVTGRLMAESYEEMNPDARNTMAGGQGTYGVAQWRGSRMNDLANFAGVDVGGITSLPATTPGGGLLTPSGGANMMPMDPTKKPYMMGGDQTYSSDPQAAQQAQPKQGGLGGLLSTLKDKAAAVNPQTGMTVFQQFASALDPLIMKQFRGGESIREAGAGRVAAGNKNRTVEMLKARGRDDLAEMVERGMISPTDAAGQLLAQSKSGAGFRPATKEEAEIYGAQAGQIDTKTGKFFPTQKVDITQTVDSGGTFTEAGAKAMGQNYADMAAAGRDAGTSLVRVAQLEMLLDETETGISAGFASKFNQYFGVDFRTAPAAAAEAMISQLVPAQRPPGSGVISDADLALYKASLPQIQALPGGNKLIVQNMKTILEHNRKVGQIASRALTDPSFTMAMAEDEIAQMTEATFASIYSALDSPAAPTLTPSNADDLILPTVRD